MNASESKTVDPTPELNRLKQENRLLKGDLQRSQDYLELLDNLDMHVFQLTDPQTYGRVNNAHAEFFGLKKENLEHRNLYDILPADEAKICVDGNTQLFLNKEEIVTEETLARADGEKRIFSFTKTPKVGPDGKITYVVCTGEDITEKKEAERILAFTRLTIDQAKIAIFWCHADGNFFFVNRTACDWLQYSFDEIKQMHLTDINPQFPREAWDAHWAEIKSKGIVHMESVHRRKNGEEYPVELYSSYVQFEGQEYNLSFVSDISDKVETRKALAASEHFLHNVLESIQDGVSVLDQELNIIHVNKVMRDWYEDGTSLLGKKCYQAYHGATTSCEVCPSQRAFASGVAESEIIRGKEGSDKEWLEVFSYPIKDPDSNEVTGVAEFVRDITDKVKLEKQLSQAQKMEAIGTLSGGIAHDFNNILQAMLGSVQLLLFQKEENHPDQKYLQLLEKSIGKAQELISQLLLFTRKLKSNLQPVDLNKEIKGFVKVLSRTLPKMIAIEEIYKEPLPKISADINQIEQVVFNLAINASQAMPNGGVLEIQTSSMLLDRSGGRRHPKLKPGNYVVLTMRDNGSGMDQQTLNQIFEPFFTTKPPGKGTGLGLSMVYGIVASHGGDISCDSKEGEGTTFTLYFPATTSVDELISSETLSGQPLQGGKETILLVDDEEVLLDIGSEMLSQYGYTTILADSGEKALEILATRGDEIDLIILDLNMPGMGGYKCLSRIQEMGVSAKVIIASGYAVEENRIKLMESGAQAFLGKPFELRNLIETTRETLDFT